MGILNLDPHSFYDGPKNHDYQWAFKLAEKGADIIDIGAESTRPGSRPVTDEQEINRLLPVLDALGRNGFQGVLSVDTWHGSTAFLALEKGAQIINDVSACRWDPGLLDVVCHFKPGYVLMHSLDKPSRMQCRPEYDDIVSEICAFFENRLKTLTNAGLPEENICLDPGIGFGKTVSHNLEILRNLSRFSIFGRPVLVGLSMKSMFEKLFGLPLEDRRSITTTASVLAWQNGAFWHRVHKPGDVANALSLAALLQSGAII